MRVGDLVRFKLTDYQHEWMVGLLMRYDKFLKIGEVLMKDRLYYVAGRLIEVYQRGLK
jgi:hypothetical protein